MNDVAIFRHLVENTLGVNMARVRNEIYNFVQTFNDLLSVSDDEIDDFVKSTHSSNSGRANNARVLIPSNVPTALKAILFELKDRSICNALPSAANLMAITMAQINIMRRQRAEAKEHQERRDNIAHHKMEVPELKSDNFEEFELAFAAAVRRQDSMHGSIPLDYLLRDNATGNYNAAWPTREEKLANCIQFAGLAFRNDNETLYNLLVQHVGTEKGPGCNIIIRYKRTKNGRQCYLELKAHFKTEAHEQTKALKASNTIKNAHYNGNRRFTIEDYYSTMTRSFNTLDDAGAVYTLTEEQKINSFESGIKESVAVSYAIQARREWNTLLPNEQTFEKYYTIFSSLYTRHNSLTRNHLSRSNQFSRISEVNTSGHGRGRSRGGRGRNSGGRRGRGGRGRGSRAYNPYQLARQYGKFTPEARVYPREQWINLTQEQKKEVMQKKIDANWIDGNTPPNGYSLDGDGRAKIDPGLVSVLQSQIAAVSGASQTSTPAAAGMVNLPPPPSDNTAPVPPVITTTTNASTAGAAFGRQGTRQRGSDQSSVASVTVNGRSFTGLVYDAHGNLIQ